MSRRWLIAVSLVAHLAVAATLAVSGVWRLERLDPDHRFLAMVPIMAPPAPAPGGGPPTPPKPTPTKPDPVKHVTVTTTVQPTTPPDPKEPPAEDPGTGTGAGPGSGDPNATGACLENCGPAPVADPVCGNGALEAGEQCDDGNQIDGDGCAATCRTEPPRPVATRVITANVLQALRISGETQLHPDASTQNRMVRDGVAATRATVSLCIAPDGAVGSVKLVVSTRYDAYDRAILEAVGQWRYRPFLVDGVPVRACSAVSFVYRIE